MIAFGALFLKGFGQLVYILLGSRPLKLLEPTSDFDLMSQQSATRRLDLNPVVNSQFHCSKLRMQFSSNRPAVALAPEELAKHLQL